jgi:biopolymer transport protein TolQ
MFVNNLILSTNPFWDAYIQSDLLGKLIFLSLYALSIGSWIVLLHKIWLTYQAKKFAFRFYEAFQLQKFNPLSLDFEKMSQKGSINPFLDLYKGLKHQSLELLMKNRGGGTQSSPSIEQNRTHSPSPSYLSLNDINFLASHLSTTMAIQIKNLEKNLYILSTTVSLAPFLGLLGTVWGILNTFSQLQAQFVGSTHQMVLGGLSLALATTVLGLLDAIPALIGYNYLKNSIRDFSMEMELFSNEVLAAVELQYRKTDL